MPINTAGAQQILDIITTHPALYDQSEWSTLNIEDDNGWQYAALAGLTAEKLIELDQQHNDSEYNECGTTFCVAGWGTMLAGYTVYKMPLGKFAKRFGTDLVAEMYSEYGEIVHAAHETDYDRLNRLGDRPTFYRDPDGQWLHNGYGPHGPSFSKVGAQFLGLTTPHGAFVANRLFRGDAGRDEVIAALTALAQGRYPEVLVERQLKQIDRLRDACLDGQYDLELPTAGNLAPDTPEGLAAYEQATAEVDGLARQTREMAYTMAHNLRQMRRVYTVSNLTDPAPQAADLTATINV